MTNPAYILLRLLRRSTPHFLARRLLSNDFLPPENLVNGAKEYLSSASDLDISIKDMVVAEIGPGAYNPASISFLTRGADKVILVEPYAEIKDVEYLRKRIRFMFEKVCPFPDQMVSINSFLDGAGYKGKVKAVKGHAEATSLPNESVDIVVSRSVLEHITNPAAAIKEQARILKKGGFFFHYIDLRDHIFRWPFEMLTFSKATWENMLTNPKNGAGYQNRLRSDDWLLLFSAVKEFSDLKINVVTTEQNALKRVAQRLDKEFLNKDPEILTAAIIVISGRKSIQPVNQN